MNKYIPNLAFLLALTLTGESALTSCSEADPSKDTAATITQHDSSSSAGNLQDSSSPLRLRSPSLETQLEYQSPFGGTAAPETHTCYASPQNLPDARMRICPFDKYQARRRQGSIHGALDLYGKPGIKLYPVKPGKVVGAGAYKLVGGKITKDPRSVRNGNTVRILSPDGLEVTYAHLNSVKVKIGQKVGYDTQVGTLGITGNASAANPHVHIQFKRKGKIEDPLPYFPFLTGEKATQKAAQKQAPADCTLGLDIAKDAETLRTEYQTPLSPENLVYLARLLYSESGTNGKNDSELTRGLDAVAHTILNRRKFDRSEYQVKQGKNTVTKNMTGQRRFSADGTLVGVIKHPGAFEALIDNPDYFNPSTFKDQEGNYTLAKGIQCADPDLQRRLKLSYSAALRALQGRSKDPANGALYYNNPKKSESAFPRPGALAFSQEVPKHQTAKAGIEERTDHNYFLVGRRDRTRIGAHYFYPITNQTCTTTYDNNWRNYPDRRGKTFRRCH